MSQSKADIIEERKANLPLPEQPPVASDFNSADARTVNVGAGGRSEDLSHEGLGGDTLRSPATGDSAVRTDGDALKQHTAIGAGRQAADGLSGLPSDAVTKEARKSQGVTDTMGKDYGYPEKSDPSSGLK
jgi:hypothetical protein